MIDNLVRKHLRSFKPYTSARSEIQQGRVFLDANELALGSPVEFAGVDINRYPDPFQTRLRARLASLNGISPEQVFVGAGSDEVIDLLIRLFCEPGRDSIAVAEPTYGVYRVAAAVSGVETLAIELDEEFQLNVQRTLQALRPTTKLLILCSPNNPTGNLLSREAIVSICRSTQAIVVVDQAYVEFSGPAGNLADEVNRCGNLLVLRTLSKAWGLAGIRLGYCLCDPLIVSYLLRIKSPYNISAVTSDIACRALDQPEFLQHAVSEVVRERDQLSEQLALLTFVNRVFRSDANFVLVSFKDSDGLFGHLKNRGIIVRRRSETRIKDCLRITVGTSVQNELLLEALKDYR